MRRHDVLTTLMQLCFRFAFLLGLFAFEVAQIRSLRKQLSLRTDFANLSLSDTEHTAYTVGHPCKPYIQPNQPWPYPSYTRDIRVYPWKPCMIFKTFKKLTRVPCPCIIVYAIVQGSERPYETVQDRERPCEAVRDRIYNRSWTQYVNWNKHPVPVPPSSRLIHYELQHSCITNCRKSWCESCWYMYSCNCEGPPIKIHLFHRS